MYQSYFPGKLALPFTGTSYAGFERTLSVASNYLGIGFMAEETVSVKKVALWISAKSGTDNITVSIETTNTNGSPSGTTIVTETIGVGSLTAPGWNEITFTTAGTITRGTRYAIKLTAASTFTSSVTLLIGATSYSDLSWVPYGFTGTPTVYSPENSRVSENFVLIASAGTPSVYGAFATTESLTSIAATGASNVVEIGNRFKVASSLYSTYKVVGLRICGDSVAQTTPNLTVSIYDWNGGTSSTALCQETFSPQMANITGRAIGDVYFNTQPTLNAGSEYIACIGTDGTTGTVVVFSQSVQREIPLDYKPALWDHTTDFAFDRVQRTSLTGSWSVATGEIASMWLLIEPVTFPSSGGLKLHPGMAGGMRG